MSSVSVLEPVIVIFGAAVQSDGRPSPALRNRVAAAAAFGQGCIRPLYLPTGAVGRFGASEASVMAAALRERGVPADAILLEETGTDTLSSVRAVVRLLRARRIEAPVVVATSIVVATSVFVATSSYHVPRCVMLLRLAGIAARACPPWPASDPLGQRWYWRLREVAALPYDLALMVGLRLIGRT